MTRIRSIFFDAGGTLVDLDYRHMSEVLEESRRAAGAAGATGAAGERGGIGIPAHEDFAHGEQEARAWFIDLIRSGGAPADAWNGYFERVYAGAGVGREEIPSLLASLWRRNVAHGLWHRPVPEAAATLESLRDQG